MAKGEPLSRIPVEPPAASASGPPVLGPVPASAVPTAAPQRGTPAPGDAGLAARRAALFERAPAGVLALDRDGRIEVINPAAAELLGWTAPWLVGRTFVKWIVGEDAAAFADHLHALASGDRPSRLQLRLKTRHGRIRDVLFESVAVGGTGAGDDACGASLSVLLDISEDRRGERQARAEQAKLMQAARVNTMGEMASSLAHELNQPLGAILLDSHACLGMVRDGTAGTRLEATLARICDAAAYAGEIIRHLRRSLRSGDGEREAVDLNALIVEAMRLIEPDARDHEVSIRLALAPSLPRALAHPVQIEQVLLNLVRNSIDAFEGAPHRNRQVTVRTEPADDGQVRFSVCDSGPGVPAQVAARLFDPFVTTKAGGMGLGLSISRSIAEAHAGRLWLDRDASPGATFHCLLPVAVAEASS